MHRKDMNEKAALDAGATAFINEKCNRKRSYQLLGGPEDEQEDVRYRNIGRSFSEEEVKFESKRAKVSRKNTFDHTNTLMQGLESPSEALWHRQGESSLASSANPSLLSIFSVASFSPTADERYQVQPEEPLNLPIRQQNQPWTGLYPQPPQAHVDPQASCWNYAQAYMANPQGVAMLPPHNNTVESVAQQHAAAAAAAAAAEGIAQQHADAAPNVHPYYSHVNSGYAAPHTVYPYQYSEQYPAYGMMSTQASMPAQQQYSTHSSYYQQDTTKAAALTNNSSHYAMDPPQPDERKEQNGHPPVLLYMHNDDDILSEYQIFLRKQIEFFEADKADVNTATPGRKKPVALGQVGIRCKHCANVPIPHRKAAAVYFPSRLKGLYQACQNIGSTHLRNSCPNLPDSLKAVVKTFQVDGKRATAGHGGKHYWSDAALALGIIEAEDGLRFLRPS